MISPTCQIHNLEGILKTYLPEIGYFVEVGAFDGYSYSNTWHLANNGWKGIYVEPIAEYADKCRETHRENNVRIIEAACSNLNGFIKLFKGQDIVSANNDMVKGYSFEVPCFTLDTILENEIINPDLLVIDVEFHEKEVLQGLTLKKWKPKMVIIEAHEHHENESYRLNADFINDYFRKYKKIYSDGINNIYVR